MVHVPSLLSCVYLSMLIAIVRKEGEVKIETERERDRERDREKERDVDCE